MPAGSGTVLNRPRRGSAGKGARHVLAEMIVPTLPQAALCAGAAFAVAAFAGAAFMGTMCAGAVFTPAAADPVASPVPSVNYPSRDPDTRLPDRVPVIAERQPREEQTREEPAPAAMRSDSVIEYRYMGGAWGHWDHDRRFHAAPAAIARELEERRHAFPGGTAPHAFPRAENPSATKPHAGKPGGEETRQVNGLPNGQRGGIVPQPPMPREYRLPR